MEFQSLFALLTFCTGVIFTSVDIGSDVALAQEYWSNCFKNDSNKTIDNNTAYDPSNRLDAGDNCVFTMPTTLWIALCGIVQFFIIARCLYRGDARVKVLPKPIRALLLCSSLILLGPIVLNVFGAALVLQHTNDDRRTEDIVRYS